MIIKSLNLNLYQNRSKLSIITAMMIVFPCLSHSRCCGIIIDGKSHLVFIEVFYGKFYVHFGD